MDIIARIEELLQSPPEQFAVNYDSLFWALVTSSEDVLQRLAFRIYEPPMIDMPRPLQVMVVRIAVLSMMRGSAVAEAKDLMNTLASLLDPAEEHDVLGGFKTSNEA
jgi:hypothetical protein